MEDDLTAEEQLISRHRQEKKQLQGEITKLRHSSKNDKKKKKEAAAQITELEAALQRKHDQEKEEFHKSQQEVEKSAAGIEKLSTDVCNDDQADVAEGNTTGRKLSKAQKRREKKAREEKERDERIRAAEIDNLQGPRHLETQAIKRLLTDRELAVFEIPSDGNCLYAAINHQLRRIGDNYSVGDLRKMTAAHMRGHIDNFLPFLSKPDTGEPFSEDEFEQYCTKLEATLEWGGHLEIQALSNVLRCPIEVVQAGSPSVISGEEHHTSPVVLTYHRHAFGLGEHYNSVIPLSEAPKEDEDELR